VSKRVIVVTRRKAHTHRSLIASVALVVAIALALLGLMSASSGAAPGDTARVSVTDSGAQANGGSSDNPSISTDGRHVAFISFASNLVPNDTGDQADIFVRDRTTDTTERVSVDSAGAQADNYSHNPSMISDGRYVAFDSRASNLVADDTNGQEDTFVRDLQARTTVLAPLDAVCPQQVHARTYSGGPVTTTATRGRNRPRSRPGGVASVSPGPAVRRRRYRGPRWRQSLFRPASSPGRP
jgi:Tol biopolymer transport system component